MNNNEELSVTQSATNVENVTEAQSVEETTPIQPRGVEAQSVEQSQQTSSSDTSTETTTLAETTPSTTTMSVPFIGLSAIQFIVSFLLIIIVLQQSKTATGMTSTVFGGDSSSYWNKNKGRSKESKQARLTVILAVIFFIVTIALTIIK